MSIAILRSVRRRSVGATVLLFALAVGLMTVVFNVGGGIEHDLRNLRADWRLHPSSGQVVIVEVDARSVAMLDHWPWPRRYWTTALDRITAAHPRSIGFDIDFSSVSTAADDAAFAEALQRQGGAVILPTFSQYAQSSSRRTLDTLPLDGFRKYAFVAGVNVTPDTDGIVRSYPLQIATDGVTRPSIGAMLAETGNAGAAADFPIDYAIDANTIPRISFIDLYRGTVPPSALAGKRVLIGATAIELGDRYPAPGLGVVPGVVVQALAAETLIQEGTRVAAGPLPLILFALISIGALLYGLAGRNRIVALCLLTVVTFFIPLPVEGWGVELDVVPALAMILAALAAASAAILLNELRSRRFVDQDSGLPNARALEQLAARMPRVDIVVARLDRLTEIAAAMGHATANTVLTQIAARMAAVADGEIYRVEEDALAWIAPADGDDEAESAYFRAAVAAGRLPIEVAGAPIEVRAAFGVSSGSGQEAKDLIAGAQIAARRARARGGDWDRFVEGDGDTARWELSMLGAFSDAIENGELWVAYQPKVAASDCRIVGAEALVRWRHPTRGMIPPDSFIPLVESEGRALELTAFVLRTAIADLARWRRAGAEIRVAVNISATLLHDPALVPMVAAAIAHERIDPSTLTLELTESAIIADADVGIATIDQLRDLGVKLSIDDYGTGQSTLTYLKRFPANELKIDKSFVQNIVRSASDHLLVRSTIELAHAMGMTVVAEGVEDRECLDALRAIGCDTIQGWHTGKPMAAAEFGSLLVPHHLIAA